MKWFEIAKDLRSRFAAKGIWKRIEMP